MSEYFRVLERIEREQRTEEVPTAPAASDAAEAAGDLPAPSPESPSVDNATAYATLFENLRTLTHAEPLRSIVFAAAAGNGVHHVVTGLAEHVGRLGLTVRRIELTEEAGPALLRRQRSHVVEPGSPVWPGTANLPAVMVDAHGGPVPDLLLFEGRALSESIDAALMARACNGLVILATPGTTSRAALRMAADRARAVGCQVLGLVMVGTTDHRPRWLRHLVDRWGGLRKD